jgi:hypothetical protein
MAIAHENVDFELMLDAMVKQEQHDFSVMLTIRNQSLRSRSLTGTLVAEDWLERHGMPAEDRRTCQACLAWSDGHVHRTDASHRVLVSAAH